jgi:hypothetical protein
MAMVYTKEKIKDLNKNLTEEEKEEKARTDESLSLCVACLNLFEPHLKGLWGESACSEECKEYLQ